MKITTAKNELRIDLRVVFYRESGFWIAHCLEMDLLGHAADKETALENLGEAIGIQIEDSYLHSNPANIVQLADPKYFKMYFSGRDEDVASVALVIKQVQKATRGSKGIRVNDIKAREFPGTAALA